MKRVDDKTKKPPGASDIELLDEVALIRRRGKALAAKYRYVDSQAGRDIGLSLEDFLLDATEEVEEEPGSVREVGKEFIKICPVCGMEFTAPTRQTRICSPACLAENRQRIRMDQMNRPFTEMTVYLVHKYMAEGESIEQIMEDMGRSRESVLEALGTPLSEKQVDMLEKRLLPRNIKASVRNKRNPASGK